MSDMTTPLLSEEQRKRLEHDADEWRRQGRLLGVSGEIDAALAEIDRLRSQVAALAEECAYLSHDHREEGGTATARLIERAVSEEREAACKIICKGCEEGVPIRKDEHGWAHVYEDGRVYGCAADDLRQRGPILLPLPPTVMQQRYEEMRKVTQHLIEVLEGPGPHPGTAGAKRCVEAAQGLLGRGK